MTHTPGPWQAVKLGNCSDATAPWEVNIISNGNYAHLPRTRANACLIESAPELLKSLKSCVEIWEDLYSRACDINGDYEEIETFEKAAAIIAKATGN